MTFRLVLMATISVILTANGGHAQANLESSKLSPGVVTQGTGLESSKLAPGIVVQNSGLQSPKLSPSVVVSNSGFQSSKLSVGIVVMTLSAGTLVPRAPLTHW